MFAYLNLVLQGPVEGWVCVLILVVIAVTTGQPLIVRVRGWMIAVGGRRSATAQPSEPATLPVPQLL